MNPLTERQRREQLALRNAVVAALVRVWPALDPERLDETFPGWMMAVAAIVAQGRRSSAGVASAYVRQLRASSGVPGDPPLVEPPGLPLPVLQSSLAVTGPVAIKRAMAHGVPLERAVSNAFVLSAQSTTRHVLNAGREVVRASVTADRRAEGWRRVTSGRACDFCDSLADRVYAGEADFPSHDGCGCSAEPVYR